ncbi:hypothetical protein RHSIM_Rhsim04G0171900 [Rhododendron simsii]|uniref:Retroviral polymerase SH3-like domain-containing protein n=1 Tax=Rhododendron simsii TaxID=118357 RepID=A0A834GXK0_RHOSS|nr:hypothetical protein RHSIM_Rhsim04G0171900 [Rhododendron simsii]
MEKSGVGSRSLDQGKIHIKDVDKFELAKEEISESKLDSKEGTSYNHDELIVRFTCQTALLHEVFGGKLRKKHGAEESPGHLRVFGSIAYAQVPEQKRSKLDDRSEKYVFIGYDSRSKGYKLYNPSNGKVISSRDVVFDEEGTWNWETQEEEQYDFFPSFQESWEEREEPEEPMTPPLSPTPNQEDPSSEESSNGRPYRMRNLQELYERRCESHEEFLAAHIKDLEELSESEMDNE